MLFHLVERDPQNFQGGVGSIQSLYYLDCSCSLSTTCHVFAADPRFQIVSELQSTCQGPGESPVEMPVTTDLSEPTSITLNFWLKNIYMHV